MYFQCFLSTLILSHIRLEQGQVLLQKVKLVIKRRRSGLLVCIRSDVIIDTNDGG